MNDKLELTIEFDDNLNITKAQYQWRNGCWKNGSLPDHALVDLARAIVKAECDYCDWADKPSAI